LKKPSEKIAKKNRAEKIAQEKPAKKSAVYVDLKSSI